MAKKKTIESTIITHELVQPKEKKITLRSLVTALIASTELDTIPDGMVLSVSRSAFESLAVFISAPLKAARNARPKESRRYEKDIENPRGYLDRVMQQFTMQSKRKKLGVDGTALSASVMTISYAANELEMEASARQAMGANL